jgi:Outer membrane protein beta-barrel domain
MKNWPRPGAILSDRRSGPRSHQRGLALLAVMACCVSLPARAQYHALPTASRAGDLQIGGGLILGTSDYNFTSTRLTGGAFYTTFDARSHWGGEFNFHQSQSSVDSTVYERTFEVGPRIYLDRERIAPYAKVLYGRGIYNFHNNVANLAYNMYTFGGGADFAITRSINLRGDYEYQNWAGFPLGTLHPSVVTIGVAFHFHE